jgi:hypothetical protein
MLVGSLCSPDHVRELKLYNPYPGYLHNVPKTTPDDEGIQTIVSDRSSVIDQNGPNAVPIITYKTPEDIVGKLLHCQWEGSGTWRYFKLDKGQSLPSGLGIKHGGSTHRLSEKDLNRWTRATVSMRQELEKYSSNKDLRIPHNCLVVRSENLGDTAFNVKDFREGIIEDLDDDPLFWVMLIALPIIYGSVHLAAWNFEFPTEVEKIIWRVACVIVAGGIPGGLLILGIITVTITVLADLCERAHLKTEWMYYLLPSFLLLPIALCPTKPNRDSTSRSFIEYLLRLVRWIIIGCVLFAGLLVFLLPLALYFGARLFIIIESFISIRRLPLGVFITVDWADYIPHL